MIAIWSRTSCVEKPTTSQNTTVTGNFAYGIGRSCRGWERPLLREGSVRCRQASIVRMGNPDTAVLGPPHSLAYTRYPSTVADVNDRVGCPRRNSQSQSLRPFCKSDSVPQMWSGGVAGDMQPAVPMGRLG